MCGIVTSLLVIVGFISSDSFNVIFDLIGVATPNILPLCNLT